MINHFRYLHNRVGLRGGVKVRCYLPPEAWVKGKVSLPSREAHHLSHVLRLKVGARITCFDGTGREAAATVRQMTRREVLLTLGKPIQVETEPWTIRLGVAAPGHGKLDTIVNQATQLGVKEIVPILTTRSVIRRPQRQRDGHPQRLTQIAIEAGKQSGRSELPVVRPLTPWGDLLPHLSEMDLVLIATVQGPHEDLEPLILSSGVQDLFLLIGPEGDWTDREISQVLEMGAHRFSLGLQVLRTDTACMAALSIVTYLLRHREAKG